MAEFVISTIQKTPPDLEICELTATICDKGVEIYAKSPIIAEFIGARNTGSVPGEDYVRTFKDLNFYIIPSRLGNEIGANGIYGDMFIQGERMPGMPRIAEPNLVWMRLKGLDSGVKIIFPQPAHVPADLIEYLNRSMEKVRIFYMKNIRKTLITSKLIERF